MKPGKMLLRLLCTLTLSISPVFAYDLTISPLGEGKFNVSGAAMNGVAGIDLIIEYDSSILSGPAITKGVMFSGTNAMMAANTTKTGNIKIAIINTGTFNGSGQLLTVNFSGKSGPGGITSMIAKTIDIKGAPLPTNSYVIPDADSGGSQQQPGSGGYLPMSQTTSQPYAPPPASLPISATTPSIGSITLPGEGIPSEPAKKQDQPAVAPQAEQYRQPAPRAEEYQQPEAKPKKIEELKRVGYVSVLERFKSYNGDRNPLILKELFSRQLDSTISQEPLIIFADGKATLKLKVLLNLQVDDPAPNFAASEAKMISFSSDEATGRWIVELLPARGSTSATLSILAGNRLLEIPLTTVPAIKGLNFSEKEMTDFSKDYEAEKPLHDLNKDGRHDYIDDYIYAGNLLLTGKKQGAAK